MWEIEALMENTIRFINKNDFLSNGKRSLIWDACHLQS